MKPGSLVIKSSRWEPDSRNIGIAIQRTEEPDAWMVMWTRKKGSYKLQIHLESALIELNGSNDDLFLERACTSK